MFIPSVLCIHPAPTTSPFSLCCALNTSTYHCVLDPGTPPQCIPVCWYMGVDFQLYIVAPLMFLPILYKRKPGESHVLKIFFLSSSIKMMSRGILTYPIIIHTNVIKPYLCMKQHREGKSLQWIMEVCYVLNYSYFMAAPFPRL